MSLGDRFLRCFDFSCHIIDFYRLDNRFKACKLYFVTHRTKRTKIVHTFRREELTLANEKCRKKFEIRKIESLELRIEPVPRA